MDHTLEIDRKSTESDALADDVREVVDIVKAKRLPQRVYETNPYAVLGVAVGVGYLLGGGLSSRFTSRIVRVGMKVLVVPLAASQLKNMSQKDT